MRLTMMLTLFVVLSGCGPMWDGTYEGNVVGRESCSDGSAGSYTLPYIWTIVETRGDLSITTPGYCSPLRATTDGTTAQMSRKECPIQYEPEYAYREILAGGTLTLRGQESLVLDLQGTSSFVFLDGSTGRCDGTITGTLRRNE